MQTSSSLRVWVCTVLLLLLLLLGRIVLRRLAAYVLQLTAVRGLRVLTSAINPGVIVAIVVLL